MDKLIANYEAWIHNEHTGEVRKLLHFSKNHIKNEIKKMLIYSLNPIFRDEDKPYLGNKNDINFEICFYSENGEKIKSDFAVKDLNEYMKELNKYLTK